MKKLLRYEINELAAINVAALQCLYEEAFSEAPATARHQLLFRKFSWRMQADHEGGLPDSARELARAIARDAPRA